MNKILTKMLADFAAIEEREAISRKQITELAEAREKAINEAQSPTDRHALEKLAVIAGQETIANRQLKICSREKDGLRAAILNEALRVKSSVNAALNKERDTLESQLDEALKPFYTKEKRRSEIVKLNTPDRLLLLQKRRIGAMLESYGNDNVKFATAVNNAAESAIHECFN